jgi:hypothetical protein
MNRIFRLVWSHRLNALVVVSEIATARGSLAAGPVVVHLKVPLSVLSIGLAFALGSGSALAAQNQTLADLEALTDKYAPLPVQVDANVALATVLNTTQAGPQLASDASVQVNLATPTAYAPPIHATVAAKAQAALPVRIAVPSAPVGALAAPTPVAATKTTGQAAVPTAPAVTLAPAVALRVAAGGTPVTAGAAVDATVALGKEEPISDGVDDAARTSLLAGVAGNAGLDNVAVQVVAADRNPKVVDADISVQATALDTSRQGLLGGVLAVSAMCWATWAAPWARSAARWATLACSATWAAAWAAR